MTTEALRAALEQIITMAERGLGLDPSSMDNYLVWIQDKARAALAQPSTEPVASTPFHHGAEHEPPYAQFARGVEEGYALGMRNALQDAANAPQPSAEPVAIGHDSRILHELAGAASLCWEPKPAGVFDAERAIELVEAALKELRESAART